jgi:hypothetical protein
MTNDATRTLKRTFSKVFAFLILTALVVTYFFDVYFNSYGISEKIKNSFLITDIEKFTSRPSNYSNSSCQIVNTSVEHETFIIDGVQYPHRVPLYLNRSLDYDCMRVKNTRPKVILFWTTWFGSETYNYGLGKSEPFTKNGCPIDNCEITADKSRLGESDLVVVHLRDVIQTIPANIPPGQRWLFFLYESPVHSANFTQLNNLFSLTATYKWDSDFYGIYPNPHFRWSTNNDFDVNQDFSRGKTEIAAMIVSNCGANSKRLDYAKQMQELVSVHVYGKTH